jgi:hypothetical protein
VLDTVPCCDKILEQINLKEERFIWAMVSEVAVHGLLAPVQWARGSQCIMAAGNCSHHSGCKAEEGGSSDKICPSKIHPQ